MPKYMGQIMAECDCTRKACETGGVCLATRNAELEAENARLRETRPAPVPVTPQEAAKVLLENRYGGYGNRKATEAAALKEAASLVPSGSDEWFDNLRPVHWKRMMAVLRKEILALIPPDEGET